MAAAKANRKASLMKFAPESIALASFRGLICFGCVSPNSLTRIFGREGSAGRRRVRFKGAERDVQSFLFDVGTERRRW